MKKPIALLLALLLALGLTACAGTEVIGGADSAAGSYVDASAPAVSSEMESAESSFEETYYIDEEGWYYSAEDVSLYLYTYGYLPENFITKSEARDLGWEGGSVERYAPGYAIGGDVFGNREGLLPEAEDRTYYECDIDTNGQDSRGAKRLVFTDDGLIYYTEDHYENFELLYGEEEG